MSQIQASRLQVGWRLVVSTALWGTLSLMAACGGGNAGNDASASAGPDSTAALASDLSGQLGSTITKTNGVMELTISGLGTKNPQTEAKWVSPPGAATSRLNPSNAADTKTIATPVPLPNFLDVAGFTTSTIDNGGFRHIAATIKVRNAPQCPAVPGPGQCAGYTNARQNVTFFAVLQTSTINQTAVSRFRRFDGSDANPALTTQLLPAHGLAPLGTIVDPTVASMQVYRESETPTPDADVISVFPYGFVVRNVSNGSRILPANPAPGQYDGIVTFGFKIPLQTPATEDPFKISLRFQTADDSNLRVTQSPQEQSFAGDLAASNRALALTGVDLAVLSGRLAQTTIGDPICSVRTAGPVGAATAYLVNNTNPAPNLAAAPMNLSFVERTSSVSLGFCENMAAPNLNTLVVNGSQSGRRSNSGFSGYGGTVTGGVPQSPLSLNRPNQLVLSTTGSRPFFPGEEVSYTATSANKTVGNLAIAPIVGSFRIKGSSVGSGNFGAPSNFATALRPSSVRLGDVNADGRLDLIVANDLAETVSVSIGNGSGGFSAPTNLTAGTAPVRVALGDFNGDGALDIIAVNRDSNNLSVMLNNGTGSSWTLSSVGVGTEPQSAAVGDINGDGRLDLVVANNGSSSFSILIGNGSGGFAAATNILVTASPFSVTLGDVNNDGTLDIVAASVSTGLVSVLIGNGAGGFGGAASFAVGVDPTSVSLGDLNGDGKLDIAAVNSTSETVSVLIGDGAGGFTTAVNYPVASGPNTVAIGDVNGDNRLDIVTSNFHDNNVSVLIGNGAGGFAAATAFGLGFVGSPTSVTLGDVNGDSRLDVVTTNTNTNNASVLLGL